MNVVIWAVSIALIALFALSAVGHACCIARFLVKGTHFSSLPLLGGILGGVGFLLTPYPTLRHLWWLPSILDYGSVPWLLSGCVVLVRKRLRRK